MYHGDLRLNHLDVYRLDDIAETLDLDLPELLEDGVTVIEWGEQIEAALPAERLTVEMRYPPLDDGAESPEDDRRLIVTIAGPSWAKRRHDVARALAPWAVAR